VFGEVSQVQQRPFVDYYEVLQLNQAADHETVERVYRLLAKRYHPDNQQTGNSSRFADVHEAYEVLSDPKRRAEYDVRYEDNRGMEWKIFNQASATDGREQDRRIFHGVLSLLYAARRRDPAHGGVGAMTLEKLLGVPRQHLDFPIWYLKKRGWVETMDNGQYGITVDGIDKLGDRDLAIPQDRLLTASSVVGTEAAGEEASATGAQGTGAPQSSDGGARQAAPSESSQVAQPSAPPTEPDDVEMAEARDRARAVAERLRGGQA